MKESREHVLVKSKSRMEVNLTLLGIAFTVFTFIIAVNPSLVRDNVILSLQLTLAIPLLSGSIFARSKLSYAANPDLWERYGFSLFIIAYSFLLNTVGILLAELVNDAVGIVFLGVNILCALAYSAIEVYENPQKLKKRLLKDLFFVSLIVFLGVLPVIGR